MIARAVADPKNPGGGEGVMVNNMCPKAPTSSNGTLWRILKYKRLEFLKMIGVYNFEYVCHTYCHNTQYNTQYIQIVLKLFTLK